MINSPLDEEEEDDCDDFYVTPEKLEQPSLKRLNTLPCDDEDVLSLCDPSHLDFVEQESASTIDDILLGEEDINDDVLS